MEVKFATRFDSPACIDIFDKKIEIKDGRLLVEATCMNDKKRLLYKLELDLFDKVKGFDKKYEMGAEEYRRRL